MIKITALDYNNLEVLNTKDTHKIMNLLKRKWEDIYNSDGYDTRHKFYDSSGEYYIITTTHAKDSEVCFLTVVKHTLEEVDITID